MDQPFESDGMEDLAAELPISSADDGFDQYESMDEGFEADAFADAIDEVDAEAFRFDENAFEDNFEGDVWSDNAAADEFKEHQSNQRESNRGKHERGQRRRGMDQSGEVGDDRRRPSRRRPPGHRGPWPPRQNSFSDELMDDAIDVFSDQQADEDSFAAEFYADRSAAAGGANPLDAMEAAIADALDAEDSHEFLRRAVGSIRRAATIAQQASRSGSQAARTVTPIARVANMAGQLLADGVDEFEALEEFLSFAETEDAIDAAMPMIAGLAVRSRMARASRLPRPVRRQLVRSIRRSGRALTQRSGGRSLRAIPAVVQAVQRTAVRRQLPVQALPQAIERITTHLVSNPRLVERLLVSIGSPATTSDRCQCAACRGAAQRLVFNGPVEILIRSR